MREQVSEEPGQAENLCYLTAEESEIMAEDDGHQVSPSEVCSIQNTTATGGKEGLPTWVGVRVTLRYLTSQSLPPHLQLPCLF